MQIIHYHIHSVDTHNRDVNTGLYAFTDINIVVSLYTAIRNNGGDPNLIQFEADDSNIKI